MPSSTYCCWTISWVAVPRVVALSMTCQLWFISNGVITNARVMLFIFTAVVLQSKIVEAPNGTKC